MTQDGDPPGLRFFTAKIPVGSGNLGAGACNRPRSAGKGLIVSLGVRNEGAIAHDLFGGSRGSRRPGFAVAVEPGFTYSREKISYTIAGPIAVHRNRTITFGSAKAGDAAFADWSLNPSFPIRL